MKPGSGDYAEDKIKNHVEDKNQGTALKTVQQGTTGKNPTTKNGRSLNFFTEPASTLIGYVFAAARAPVRDASEPHRAPLRKRL